MLEINDLIKELDKKLIVTKTEIIDRIMYIYIVIPKSKKQKRICGKKMEGYTRNTKII